MEEKEEKTEEKMEEKMEEEGEEEEEGTNLRWATRSDLGRRRRPRSTARCATWGWWGGFVCLFVLL